MLREAYNMKQRIYSIQWLAAILVLCRTVSAAELPTTTQKPDTTKNAAMEQDLQYVNPGEEISAQTGQNFSMLLSSNPTTGFRWSLAVVPEAAIATLITNEYIPPAKAMIGAGGNEKWSFRAVGKGRTSISFIYTRPWEKDAEPARRETFSINVR